MSAKPVQPGSAPPAPKSSDPDAIEAMTAAPLKTPLFQAINAARYQRQSLIRRIQELTGRPLICYVAGIGAAVSRDDTLGFADLLYNIRGPIAIDLLLHTPGGDIDAAEKLVAMIRTKVGDKHMRAIVPDFAKSAGTLMVLGADSVLMSDASELGPIDPQVTLADEHGNLIQHSVQDYLDAFSQHAKTLAKNPDDVTAQIMLRKLDPSTVKHFEAVHDRARAIAEKLLKQFMFQKSGGNWSQAVSRLLNRKTFPSHGQMISWQDAKDPEIGLTVEYEKPESPLWCYIWQLYCLQRLAITARQKLFESDVVSIPIDSAG